MVEASSVGRLWPYWRLKTPPHTEYKLAGLANMHPNWEAYTIMECVVGGYVGII